MLQPEITETEKLLQLATRVLTEEVGGDIFLPTYLFSQTADNNSQFCKAEELLRRHASSALYVFDDRTGANTGYPGATFCENQLLGLGVPLAKIRRIPFNSPTSFNTYTEALRVVEFAREQEWCEMVIVAPAFHQLRCFVTMVSAMSKLGVENLAVWNQTVHPDSWSDEVRHSQGTLRAPRAELIIHESRRISAYQANGSLVSLDEVFQYLSWRDGAW